MVDSVMNTVSNHAQSLVTLLEKPMQDAKKFGDKLSRASDKMVEAFKILGETDRVEQDKLCE